MGMKGTKQKSWMENNLQKQLGLKEEPKVEIHLDSEQLSKMYQIGKRRAMMVHMNTGLKKNSLPSWETGYRNEYILTRNRHTWKDDRRKDQPDLKKKPLQQLQTHNMSIDDVETTISTN